MTELTNKGTVCIAVVWDGLCVWNIFGVYDNEDLARKRVEELSYLIPEGHTVYFVDDILWGAKDV